MHTPGIANHKKTCRFEMEFSDMSDIQMKMNNKNLGKSHFSDICLKSDRLHPKTPFFRPETALTLISKINWTHAVTLLFIRKITIPENPHLFFHKARIKKCRRKKALAMKWPKKNSLSINLSYQSFYRYDFSKILLVPTETTVPGKVKWKKKCNFLYRWIILYLPSPQDGRIFYVICFGIRFFLSNKFPILSQAVLLLCRPCHTFFSAAVRNDDVA